MNNDILQLKESIEAVLADVCTSAALHKFDDGAEPLDEKLWTQAGALGWLAIPLPEAAGGLGLGIEAEAALHQALGQYLAPGPYIATLAAARALAALHREDLLHGMAEGAFSLAIAAEPPQTALRLMDGRVSGATGLLLGQATARFAAVPALAEKRLRYRLDEWFRAAVNQNAACLADASARRRLMNLIARTQGVAGLLRRLFTEHLAGHGESSIMPAYVKVAYPELLREVMDFQMEMQGLAALADTPAPVCNIYPTGAAYHDYIRTWMLSIAGGTNEIMRNLIAERELGLPR